MLTATICSAALAISLISKQPSPKRTNNKCAHHNILTIINVEKRQISNVIGKRYGSPNGSHFAYVADVVDQKNKEPLRHLIIQTTSTESLLGVRLEEQSQHSKVAIKWHASGKLDFEIISSNNKHCRHSISIQNNSISIQPQK